uniref:Uncharacterized protein n=1 Tax=Physcomitrium patens TaxID=3218 RepID=A0A2K1IS73_PHYPA|nr:hypothetical protein PHYPA_026252 [Physcomitrium patens]
MSVVVAIIRCKSNDRQNKSVENDDVCIKVNHESTKLEHRLSVEQNITLSPTYTQGNDNANYLDGEKAGLRSNNLFEQQSKNPEQPIQDLTRKLK